MTPATESAYQATSTADANNVLVTGRPCILVGVQGFNARQTPVYLTLFDKATAPVAGTDTVRKKIYLPPSSAFALDFPSGIVFAAGLGFALTAGGALTDNTAIAVGDILGLSMDLAR